MQLAEVADDHAGSLAVADGLPVIVLRTPDLTQHRWQLSAGPADLVRLQEASRLGGYSVDHLQRLVASGAIPNMGRKGAPLILRSDVPRKPGYAAAGLPVAAPTDQFSARRQIVTDAKAPRGA
jgi:hypothetical protein